MRSTIPLLVGTGLALAMAPLPAASAAAESDQASALEGLALRGRAQFDALVANNDEGSTITGGEVRRFYLGVEGDLSDEVAYVVEADFSGPEVSLQDVTLAYQATPSLELVGGHFKPPVTNEDLTSDTQTLFLERSTFAGAFAPGRRVGLAANYARERWGLQAGAFGEADGHDLDGERGESRLVALRAYGDLLPGEAALHVGASAYALEMDNHDPTVSLSQRPETGRAPTAVDTGDFVADAARFVGLEAGYGRGPLTIQIEGGAINFDGPTTSPQFAGWSGQVAWRWTGEARPYDIGSGTFGRVRPDRPWGQGGFGAVETGLRVSRLDLDDGAITGGEMTTYGAVINWLPVTRLRLSANLIQARIEDAGPGVTDETLLTLRTAIDW
ncbi:OprO/OprP family phosphate-selective porin [Phenylobacterium sp.]|uniref:OprO/OprP family phosphate-selective porin n=1 Tax=Phenylobacterium sp. TaxID=1871053 RepID=UPI00272F0B39|nr:porin [Phenylobacterium sp.]MDP1619299.1 porin [Phenylobacterium sp.]MDP1987896.1 porin [Phenylobacterium sp.]